MSSPPTRLCPLPSLGSGFLSSSFPSPLAAPSPEECSELSLAGEGIFVTGAQVRVRLLLQTVCIFPSASVFVAGRTVGAVLSEKPTQTNASKTHLIDFILKTGTDACSRGGDWRGQHFFRLCCVEPQMCRGGFGGGCISHTPKEKEVTGHSSKLQKRGRNAQSQSCKETRVWL